jgi:O-6-methylguanine DNA methyltransferase
MSNSDHDELLAGLAGLAVEPPADLVDRFAAHWVRVPGPIGDLSVAFTDQGIAYVRLAGQDLAGSFRERFARPLFPADRPPADLMPALRSGQASDVRFDLRGLNDFQTDVLLATLSIPKGEVRPYSWIAREIGRPRAVRAVGSALGLNPVPVLIPCHRVTRADGTVGGYVFGPSVKEALLRSEDVDLDGVS